MACPELEALQTALGVAQTLLAQAIIAEQAAVADEADAMDTYNTKQAIRMGAEATRVQAEEDVATAYQAVQDCLNEE